MPTPIRRRFAVDTLLNDKVATVDVLNRAGFITTNDLFSGERYRILTPDSYADEVDAVSHPVEFKWLQTHFSQEGGAPADVAVIYWNKTAVNTPVLLVNSPAACFHLKSRSWQNSPASPMAL